MTQPRMNIYGFPHKGLRIALSQLSKLSGNTDYSDVNSLDKLKALATEVITILDLHVHSEEEVVLPALQSKVPGRVEENIEEHQQLEKDIQAFDEQLKSITIGSSPELGASFYNAINNFHSKYLTHMAMEESAMNALIWNNFTDEEIMSWHGKIMSTLNPDQIMLWFKYIVPSLNPFERSIIMGGFKTNAPAEFFNDVITMLKEFMSNDEHRQMTEMLNEAVSNH